MEDLFQKVRSACTPQLWSKAVEVARKQLVTGLGDTPQGLQLRVSQSLGGLSFEVNLTVDDLDWLCTCGSDDDPCYHVAAAVIALKRSYEKGEKLPISAQVGGKINYEWVEVNHPSKPPELKLRRTVVYPDGRTAPLHVKIAAMVAGRVPNPGISATPEDVEIDLQLIQIPQYFFKDESEERKASDLLTGSPPYPTVSQQKAIIALLKAIQRIDVVKFGHAPVAISPVPISLEVVIKDESGGVRLTSRQDQDIIKMYSNFLALCKSGIRPAWIPQMQHQLRDLLKTGKFYGPRDFPELVSEILPPLKEVLPINLLTHRLPGLTYGEPFLDLMITRDPSDPQTLISELKILYKTSRDGIVAAIENGRIVPLKEEIPVPTRDRAQELVLKDQAFRQFGREIGQKMYHRGKDAISLMNSRPLRDPGLPGVGADPLSDFKLYGSLAPHIEVFEHGLSISFFTGHQETGLQSAKSVEIPGSKRRVADPYQVLEAFHKGETLVPLIDGGWGEIPHSWLHKYKSQLARFLSHRDQISPKKEPHGKEKERSNVPSLFIEIHPSASSSDGDLQVLADMGSMLADMGHTPSRNMETAQRELLTLLNPPQRPLPSDLQAQLRPYQKEGYEWLVQIRQLGVGALLCDEMGLGKTLQAISVMSGQTLIIAPASVVPNWSEEIRKFRPSTKVHIYHGTGRSLNDTIKGISQNLPSISDRTLPADFPEVTLTTYGTLRTDLNKLQNIIWDTIIVDEGQSIKNPQSQISQAVHSMQSRFRVLLTGTPVENRLEDLWSQMHFANPGLLGSLADFRQTFVQPLRRTGQEARESGPPVSSMDQAWKLLHERIKPYLKRRLKSEVAPDLPSKTETIRYVELTPEEKSRYETLRIATREDLLSKMGLGGQAMLALEGLLRLRQAACHPHLLPGVFLEDQEGSVPYPQSSKLSVLVELLQESIENGHKILVFSQWTSFLKLVSMALDHHQISYCTLTGETTNRMEVVHQFQDPQGPSTLLISLKAGGVGLNLTAADHVIFVDPWWNPAVEDQAIDRTHRIGQDKPILIQRLVALHTVEEKIIALKEMKKNIAAATLNSEIITPEVPQEKLGAGMSSEEILALLD